MARFVCVRWTPVDREGEKAGRALAERLGSGWSVKLDWRGVLLLVQGEDDVSEIARGGGLVFGEVYDRQGRAIPAEDLSGDLQAWIGKLWGAYIAILIDRGYDLVHVLRDASGARACFHARMDPVHVVFSDAEDVVRLKPEIEPDLGFVAAFLRYPKIAVRRTGLEGVEEIWPGERLTLSRTGVERYQFWRPDSFHSAVGRLAQSAQCVRAAAEFVARARLQRLHRVAHRLSGGLDSAIVLGLARTQAPHLDIVCVNEFWDGAIESDERAYARVTAGAAGVRLIELNMTPELLRYERALGAPLTVKPTLASLSFADPDVAARYGELGAEAILSGQGGDHIFHRARSPLIAADALKDRLPLPRIMAIALDAARLCGRSVWDVFGAMASAAISESNHNPASGRMAPAYVADALEEADAGCHGWLSGPKTVGPARMQRLWHLLDALGYHDASVLTTVARPMPLLLAQPLIEACLETPPYVMTEGGRERALARAAFGDLIPDVVARRTMKGETTRYFAAILVRNRAWIEAALVDGELVRSGVVDADRLKAAVIRDWRQDAAAAGGLYVLLAAEIFLRALKAAKETAAA